MKNYSCVTYKVFCLDDSSLSLPITFGTSESESVGFSKSECFLLSEVDDESVVSLDDDFSIT